MTKILFLGDSLTEWFDWQTRFKECEVHNYGVSGDMAADLVNRLKGIRTEIGAPDVVFVMTGINDLLWEEFDGLDAIYTTLLENLKGFFPNSLVVIQSLLPTVIPWVDNRGIEAYNQFLKNASGRYGFDYLDVWVSFIEAGGADVKPGLLLEDGVHVSPEGYEVWSETVERYLKAKGR